MENTGVEPLWVMNSILSATVTAQINGNLWLLQCVPIWHACMELAVLQVDWARVQDIDVNDNMLKRVREEVLSLMEVVVL